NPLQSSLNGPSDAFVAKLDASGSTLVYSTYLGGSGTDGANQVTVDPAGDAYVVGVTDSADFPIANPLQAHLAGGLDGFVTKLSATGTALVYSTYLGGSGDDNGFSIAVNDDGDVYVTGKTASQDFPVANATQAAYGGGASDVYIAKLDPAGHTLLYAT